jgi:hypothetical protein
MLALRIPVTLELFVIPVPSMVLICVHALTATKELIAPKISTNAKPVRPVNMTDSALIPLVHFDVIAQGVLLVLDARSTSMNAIPTLAKMMALVSMNVEHSAVSACQVCSCLDLFRVWQ